MKIGLDIMGGDFAPEAAVLGAIRSSIRLCRASTLVLIGDKGNAAFNILTRQQLTALIISSFVHTTEVIGMGEHPTKAIVQKIEPPASAV